MTEIASCLMSSIVLDKNKLAMNCPSYFSWHCCLITCSDHVLYVDIGHWNWHPKKKKLIINIIICTLVETPMWNDSLCNMKFEMNNWRGDRKISKSSYWNFKWMNECFFKYENILSYWILIMIQVLVLLIILKTQNCNNYCKYLVFLHYIFY